MASVMSLFVSLGISAWRDYLAGNGRVPDATRILHYRLTGDASEVTVLVKRILAELYGVSERTLWSSNTGIAYPDGGDHDGAWLNAGLGGPHA